MRPVGFALSPMALEDPTIRSIAEKLGWYRNPDTTWRFTVQGLARVPLYGSSEGLFPITHKFRPLSQTFLHHTMTCPESRRKI